MKQFYEFIILSLNKPQLQEEIRHVWYPRLGTAQWVDRLTALAKNNYNYSIVKIDKASINK